MNVRRDFQGMATTTANGDPRDTNWQNAYAVMDSRLDPATNKVLTTFCTTITDIQKIECILCEAFCHNVPDVASDLTDSAISAYAAGSDNVSVLSGFDLNIRTSARIPARLWFTQAFPLPSAVVPKVEHVAYECMEGMKYFSPYEGVRYEDSKAFKGVMTAIKYNTGLVGEWLATNAYAIIDGITQRDGTVLLMRVKKCGWVKLDDEWGREVKEVERKGRYPPVELGAVLAGLEQPEEDYEGGPEDHSSG